MRYDEIIKNKKNNPYNRIEKNKLISSLSNYQFSYDDIIDYIRELYHEEIFSDEDIQTIKQILDKIDCKEDSLIMKSEIQKYIRMIHFNSIEEDIAKFQKNIDEKEFYILKRACIYYNYII